MKPDDGAPAAAARQRIQARTQPALRRPKRIGSHADQGALDSRRTHRWADPKAASRRARRGDFDGRGVFGGDRRRVRSGCHAGPQNAPPRRCDTADGTGRPSKASPPLRRRGNPMLKCVPLQRVSSTQVPTTAANALSAARVRSPARLSRRSTGGHARRDRGKRTPEPRCRRGHTASPRRRYRSATQDLEAPERKGRCTIAPAQALGGDIELITNTWQAAYVGLDAAQRRSSSSPERSSGMGSSLVVNPRGVRSLEGPTQPSPGHRLRAAGRDRRRRHGRRLRGAPGVDRPHRRGQDAQGRRGRRRRAAARSSSPKRSSPASSTIRTSCRSTTWARTTTARCSTR